MTDMTVEIWEPHAPGEGEPREVTVGGFPFLVTAENVRSRVVGAGVVELELTGPGVVRGEWRFPCVDVTALWTPDSSGRGWIPAAWTAPQKVSLSRGAPIASLVGTGDVGVCTFAALETEVLASGGVFEETGEFRFWVQADDRLTLRVDFSRRHYAHALAELTTWWLGGHEPSIPAAARKPAYSTWYSMHQNVTPEAVERQAALGKELGLDVIIVDDGWMTLDRGRGYGHCGDWEPLSLPDTAAHVERVHALGLDYLLWYAITFVGKDSEVWERFQAYALFEADYMNAIVVDPRYPVVREHLAGKLARAVEEWGMDGLKIDFVDWFARADPPEAGPEADCVSVSDGVRKLLAEVWDRISAAHPGALVEFRQPYVSHGLWPYTTMIRATDCPLSPAENRQRTIDVRLAAGSVPVHADMLMWHAAEPPEQVAGHLINVLFAVPQISVDLAAIPGAQREALAFWLGVFRRYETVLQLGVLEPARPDLGYPLVRARDERTAVVARYAPLPVAADGTWEELLVANADADPWIRLTGGSGTASAEVRDARGALVWEGTLELGAAVGAAAYVERGGLLTLRRVLSPTTD